jgi:probable F420-dependent oxidoreductase
MEQQKAERTLRERISLTIEANPATLAEALIKIEEAGVEQVWVAGGPPGSADVLTTLATAMTRTTHLVVGTAVIQVFSRHPVFMAQQALSLHAVAPDRLRLGIGTGAPAFAKRLYGIEMEQPLAYLREYVQVLRPLLQNGEVHYQGQYFTADASLQTPSRIPLLVATLGPKAFQFAGEVADGALPYLCPIPYLRQTALPALSAGAAKARRSRPPLIAHVPIAFTEDRTIALQAGREAMRFYTTLPTYRNMFLTAGFSEQEISAVSDHMIESLIVFGDESKIKDRLVELLGMEFDEVRTSPVPIGDAAQEGNRLARLIGSL